MILHPIAAAFGVVSVIFGLLAHMHGFAGTALTTCFASFAATFSLLAFVFDIAVFVIAKQRIESSSVGGSASLGPAVWMTLAAMVLFGLSGCFFGVSPEPSLRCLLSRFDARTILQCGACVIRKQRSGREASEKSRPLPDPEYGSKLRGEALAAHERDKAYAAQQGRHEGVLPAFTEHERDKEDIPLNSMQAVAFDDDGYQPRPYPPQQSNAGAPSVITGVGQGYGRRNDAPYGNQVSYEPGYPAMPLPAPTGTPNNAGRGTGVGSRLASDARAQRGYATEPTVEPFQGMHDAAHSTSPPPNSNSGHYPSSSAYDHQYPSQMPASSSMPAPMPAPQQYFNGPRDPYEPQAISPTQQGSYPAYPPAPLAALTPDGGATGGAFGHEKPYHASSSPPPQQQQQQSFYVQNPSLSSHQPDTSAYSHSQGHAQGLNSNGGGGGGVDRVPSTHAPTYYTYEDPYQQQNSQRQQGASIDYHAPSSGGYQNPY